MVGKTIRAVVPGIKPSAVEVELKQVTCITWHAYIKDAYIKASGERKKSKRDRMSQRIEECSSETSDQATYSVAEPLKLKVS